MFRINRFVKIVSQKKKRNKSLFRLFMSHTRYAVLSLYRRKKNLLGKTRTVYNKTFFFFHINRANALECVILLKKNNCFFKVAHLKSLIQFGTKTILWFKNWNFFPLRKLLFCYHKMMRQSVGFNEFGQHEGIIQFIDWITFRSQ